MNSSVVCRVCRHMCSIGEQPEATRYMALLDCAGCSGTSSRMRARLRPDGGRGANPLYVRDPAHPAHQRNASVGAGYTCSPMLHTCLHTLHTSAYARAWVSTPLPYVKKI